MQSSLQGRVTWIELYDTCVGALIALRKEALGLNKYGCVGEHPVQIVFALD